MINKKEFGRRLKSARERQDLLQRDVAQYLDVTPNAVGNWEQGLCYPNTGLIDDLCVALKVTPQLAVPVRRLDAPETKAGSTMNDCSGHCWVAVWIEGRYKNRCINCGETR